ncbi:protein FAM83C [Corythoichthys intestinalis]|uniref:protein FAM83C n=1 Tax=Corythoichthys intestinalis TaxID=161448 RepID=UPI0025A5D6FC|nr:protein FAM83C [Corythoichthys intestinalis]XP_061813530.1 protein FAM83C-like [Nerophis lumbriciformis]
MSWSESIRPAPAGRKPLGKLAARLEELKSPWRQVSSLELSHNEAARLATDALLEHGEVEYRRVLTEERELSFLSEDEIGYIARHRDPDPERVRDPDSNGAEIGGASGTGGPLLPAEGHDDDRDDLQAEAEAGQSDAGDVVSELTSGTYFPTMTDEEPPVLELGWPEAPLRYGPSETQIYFQRDKSVNVKDRIRSLINKAKKVIALVMDEFSDVDLLCDLMEASSKRRVPVYILLDHKKLHLFTDMCATLDVHSVNLSNMRIRSVCGDTYCAKSGRKFSGRVMEKFLIIDCEEVIAGSYSFTWLASQVHSNVVLHFSGCITESFDREFRCLYADSQIIECFYNDEDDEGLPNFPAYRAPLIPLAPLVKANLLSEKQRPASDDSSSQSGSSLSSVRAAPLATSNPVYKVTRGQERAELPDSLRGQKPVTPRPSSNGGTHRSPHLERRAPIYGLDRSKSKLPVEGVWSHRVGPSSKFQQLGMYEHKVHMFHATAPPPRLHRSHTPPPLVQDGKLGLKHRSSSNQFLHKLPDFFIPPAAVGRDHLARSASPQSTVAWGGADLSQNEPVSRQAPPPPPLTGSREQSTGEHEQINRHDQKRMTLGHSKLDLVNQYNKMKSKQVYSRFELKSSQ